MKVVKRVIKIAALANCDTMDVRIQRISQIDTDFFEPQCFGLGKK